MSILVHGLSNTIDLYLINEEEFYLGQYSVVLLPITELMRSLRENGDTTNQVRVRLSHFSACEHSEIAYIVKRKPSTVVTLGRHLSFQLIIRKRGDTYITQDLLASPHGFIPKTTVSPVSSRPSPPVINNKLCELERRTRNP